jgi:hypothetical protein
MDLLKAKMRAIALGFQKALSVSAGGALVFRNTLHKSVVPALTALLFVLP